MLQPNPCWAVADTEERTVGILPSPAANICLALLAVRHRSPSHHPSISCADRRPPVGQISLFLQESISADSNFHQPMLIYTPNPIALPCLHLTICAELPFLPESSRNLLSDPRPLFFPYYNICFFISSELKLQSIVSHFWFKPSNDFPISFSSVSLHGQHHGRPSCLLYRSHPRVATDYLAELDNGNYIFPRSLFTCCSLYQGCGPSRFSYLMLILLHTCSKITR